VSTNLGAEKPTELAAEVGDVVTALPTAKPVSPRIASLLIRRSPWSHARSRRIIC